MNKYRLFLSVLSGLTLVATGTATAQEGYALEEIVVTATKREASLQDVPVSVTAISGDSIQEGRITGVFDIVFETPNFNMTQFNIGEPQYYIRGIGNSLDSAGGDPAVATFVDEVYIGRSGGAAMDLFDLDRIEVLRGPQGTLFGKNVVGGALSIYTRKPSDQFEAKVGLTAGNYSTVGVRGLISGGLSDNTAASFSFSKRTRDGYVDNVIDGVEYHDEDNLSLRGQLLFAPTDEVEIRFVADFAEDDQNGNCRNVNNLTLNDPLGLAVVYPPVIAATTGGDIRKCASSLGAFQDREVGGIMARIDWDLANSTFTSISAYRETDYSWSEDLAGMPLGQTPFNLVDAAEEDSDQFSQEFRLTSAGGDKLDWLAGVFYMVENVDRRENFVGSFGPPLAAQGFALLDGDIAFTQNNETTSWAVFGQIDWHVTDAVTWSIGARYANDEKDIDQGLVNFEDPAFDVGLLTLLMHPNPVVVLGIPANGPVGLLTYLATGDPGDLNTPYQVSASADWDKFLPSTSLNWRYSDEGMVYFTASAGYKSGAFVAQVTTPQGAVVPLEPEDATNFEIGWKTQFADGRARLNASVFRMDYTDLQVFRLVGSLLVGANAEATSQGIELELNSLLTENWLVNASYGYLDAEYDVFDDGINDFSGNKLPRAAEHSFSINTDITVPLSGGSSIDVFLGYTYQGDYFIEPSNAPGGEQDGFGLLNANVGWTSASGNWEVIAWGKNLADEEYRTHSIISNIAGTVDLWGIPQTYGLTVNWRYQ